MDLSQKIKTFPRQPGVYLFRDARGQVLYVGKAKRLRDRVKSYFVPGRDERPQVTFLIRRTADIAVIVTDTEKEALLLENTLIKEHRPRYNISLRDDKSYTSIRIGVGHPFPNVALTRRIRKDGAVYFGPYNSAAAAREAVDLIVRAFCLRSCADVEFANRVRPCLKHDIGRCSAPCVGRISDGEYAARVEEAKLFLSGRSPELIRRLKEEMRGASSSLRYEEAARLRDVIALLRSLIERQKMVRHRGGDYDAVGLVREDGRAALCVLAVRGGTLLAARTWAVADAAGSDAALIEEFLLSHYRERGQIPSRLLLSERPEALLAIVEILSDCRGGRVAIGVPSRGELKKLVDLAVTNAREVLVQRSDSVGVAATLERLGQRLGLPGTPERIECVDISNLSGREAVGSLVVFVGGEPRKTDYRIYNIRTLSTPDDYRMMREVIERRFGDVVSTAARAQAPLERPLPDLLLVDGGKGQLSIAARVLGEIGLSFPVAAIAKGEKKGHADQVFLPGRKNPLAMKRGSRELLLLMRIRDEAHRFGIKAHRRRREKKAVASSG